MTGAAAAAVRWAPELVLAAASLAGAWAVGVRPTSRPLSERALELAAAGALVLLAIDAAFGAAEYAGLGGARTAAAHAWLTAAFRSAGFASTLGAALACVPRGGRPRGAALAVGGLGGLAASFLVPLPPPLVLAHVAGVAVRAPVTTRVAAAAAAVALAAVTASQLLMPEGTARLAVLHVGMSAWAVAFGLQVRRRRA